MNEEEALFRKQLRRLRTLATSIGFSYREHEIMFARWPQTQAWEMLDQYSSYSLAAMMLVNAGLLSGDLRSEDFSYVKPTGLSATRDEVVEDLYQLQSKRLKEKFDPLEIYSQVIMPLVKFDLEQIERFMVNDGYQLPRWQRPRWLKEIEARGLEQ